MHKYLLQQYKQNCTLKQALSIQQLQVMRPLAEKKMQHPKVHRTAEH